MAARITTRRVVWLPMLAIVALASCPGLVHSQAGNYSLVDRKLCLPIYVCIPWLASAICITSGTSIARQHKKKQLVGQV